MRKNNNAKNSLADKLLSLILLESSKPYDKIDSSFVAQGVDFLMEQKGTKQLKENEIKSHINSIPFKDNKIAIKPGKKKIHAKRIFILAAVLALVIALSLTITAISASDSSAFWAKYNDFISSLGFENRAEKDGMTFYNTKETVFYDSVEDFAAAEGIRLLFPEWLPDNEEISNITYRPKIPASKNKWTAEYVLSCKSPIYSIIIEVDQELPDSAKENSIKVINGIEFYYFSSVEFAQANFEYNGMLYTVKAYSQEDLFKIIENLKEIG